MTITLAPGVTLTPGYLDRSAQEEMLAAVRAIIAAAPLYVPRMPRSGKPMSVRMTNCGTLGWVTDAERGYRYQETHPETGAPWPPIPDIILPGGSLPATHIRPRPASSTSTRPTPAWSCTRTRTN